MPKDIENLIAPPAEINPIIYELAINGPDAFIFTYPRYLLLAGSRRSLIAQFLTFHLYPPIDSNLARNCWRKTAQIHRRFRNGGKGLGPNPMLETACRRRKRPRRTPAAGCLI